MEAGHILIVDDSDLVRAGLRELFEAAGYQITEAINGRAALKALCADPLPDVILLDIQMPHMNGITFRKHQLRNPRMAGVRVIIYSLTESPALADAMQASAHVAKSADPQVLLDTVRRIIAAA